MGDRSSIEWTDATWNPTTGCDRVSPGCDNCYAATMAKRLRAMGSPRYQTDGDPRTSGPGFGLQVHDDVLEQPLRWRKPRRVFVNSMSDLFHPKVPDEFIARVFAVMASSRQHTFQVLTKRPKRMRALLGSPLFWLNVDADLPSGCGHCEPLPNVWLGTSVEDQRRANERIPPLLETPAAVRFLSCEPLIGPVDLGEYMPATLPSWAQGIGWVIVGGESGSGARPMHPRWVRDLRDQAFGAGIPFFFKQWGAWAPSRGRSHEQVLMWPDGTWRRYTGPPYTPAGWTNLERVGKHAAGRTLDGATWDDFPEAVTS